MIEYVFPADIRRLMADALPEDTSLFGRTPALKHTYFPAGHAKALHPDSMLVVGMRGAGKSFWWAALQSESHRSLLEKYLKFGGFSKDTKVSTGFGEESSPNDYPGKDNLSRLLEAFDARQIWRTIIIYHVAKTRNLPSLSVSLSWRDRIHWVQEHPEEVERLLFDIDNELNASGTYHLVLFDALDRTADDWTGMNKLVKGLLQVLLDFRAYKRIRPKAFVRPDHLEDSSVAAFPDASKVLSQKVELNWPKNELYGLFWQYLANASEEVNIFRSACKEEFRIPWEQVDGVWKVPDALRNEEKIQRAVFHAITGPWMGRDHRRGFPYTWLPGHLVDTHLQVSPRSFLAALHHAASSTQQGTHPKFAIHYESIKKGVQEASKIRKEEMKEDYPWVESLMEPLSGLSVPCPFDEIEKRWKNNNSLKSLEERIQSAKVKLPPTHRASGASGVREDLEALGLFERMKDGRVNLPDVYRVSFGIGRRGGVKTLANG